jgi:hypothetical protein
MGKPGGRLDFGLFKKTRRRKKQELLMSKPRKAAVRWRNCPLPDCTFELQNNGSSASAILCLVEKSVAVTRGAS